MRFNNKTTRAERKRQGIGIQEMSRLTGLSISRLCEIEVGMKSPKKIEMDIIYDTLYRK